MASDSFLPYAEALDTLGLMRGTDNGYELSRTPTRGEAITMLIRVLGKEEYALEGTFSHPFTDSGWADAYIGCAYAEGLTKGISDTEFGTALPIDRNQYATMLLRAIGYSDGTNGQFKYENAYELALHKFAMSPCDGDFTRGELAAMTVAALNTPLAGQSKTAARALMSDGVFTQSQLSAAKRKIGADKQKTAVLIYAVASDLESKLGMLTLDIREILDASLDNIEIFLQTGGTKNYRYQTLTGGVTQRAVFEDGMLKVTEVPGDVPMCEEETLSDFLEYAKENITADRYVLVLWDHGEGTLGGFGRDELNSNASLSLEALRSALSVFGGGLDLIVFDACLMSTSECALALSDAGKYMIASEDITPTDGLYYTTWLSALSADPYMSTEELARLVVDSYAVHAPPDREDITLSVIRLSNAKILTDGIKRELSALLSNSGAAELLMTAAPPPYGADIGVDQYDVISLFKSVGLDTSELAREIEQTLYYKRSAVPDKYSGIAMYLPLKRGGDFARVRDILTSIGYPQESISLLDRLNQGGT